MLKSYIARRLLNSMLLLVAISMLSFLFLEIAPGRFLDEMRLDPRVSPDTIYAMRQQRGMNDPLPVRYGRWAGGALRGDFGLSLAYGVPVLNLALPRMRNTLLLTITALVLAWVICLPCGVWTAARPRSLAARLSGPFTSLLLSVPELLAAGILLLLALRTGYFPAGGMFSPGGRPAGTIRAVADASRHMLIPVLILTLAVVPLLLRHVRAALESASGAPFVQAARGLGIPERRLWLRHILRVAANPLISLMGLSVAGLISSSLLVDVLLGWPGLGPLFLDAVAVRDTPVVISVLMLSALFLVAGNLAADLLLYACDPRIRTE
ncbi:MAG: binding-protein-dependent transport system inner rane component [Bryobacterales bacterium]|nr:binding-protein-dependent transport system inner rane component [Bryobacterales bacterium]